MNIAFILYTFPSTVDKYFSLSLSYLVCVSYMYTRYCSKCFMNIKFFNPIDYLH